jgi:putative colanic acid biosynthesis acetyltransferase WcaF
MHELMSKEVDFSTYDNSWYKTGAGALKRLSWYFVNMVLFQSYLLPVSSIKVYILKIFGAKIGRGVVIKPAVNIKYPWHLEIGNHTWLGEKVWIDNLTLVKIGSNVCLSQGAMLLTGNHNYKKITFDLLVQGITLEDGVWIGAKSLVCPGLVCHSHSVLTAQSVATNNLEAYFVYSGNPAQKIRPRLMD